MELHSSRFLVDGRNRHHSPRKDYLQTDIKVEDVVLYLERLRERAERAAPPSRRTQETQTVPAALLPVTSSFLLQELPSAAAPQHLQQVKYIPKYIEKSDFEQILSKTPQVVEEISNVIYMSFETKNVKIKRY